eukprot:GEMP01004908.1.p1 GENE.GEMP01004908.1~~GEMP01004908.1.p1  ORF type:complete len:1125 (+),score=310.54 GEMP01004908.1:59-3433(+)
MGTLWNPTMNHLWSIIVNSTLKTDASGTKIQPSSASAKHDRRSLKNRPIRAVCSNFFPATRQKHNVGAVTAKHLAKAKRVESSEKSSATRDALAVRAHANAAHTTVDSAAVSSTDNDTTGKSDETRGQGAEISTTRDSGQTQVVSAQENSASTHSRADVMSSNSTPSLPRTRQDATLSRSASSPDRDRAVKSRLRPVGDFSALRNHAQPYARGDVTSQSVDVVQQMKGAGAAGKGSEGGPGRLTERTRSAQTRYHVIQQRREMVQKEKTQRTSGTVETVSWDNFKNQMHHRYGNLVRWWRQLMDPLCLHALTLIQFSEALHKIGYRRQAKNFWEASATQRANKHALTFADVSPKDAGILWEFFRMASSRCGKLEMAFRTCGLNQTNFIPQSFFIEACDRWSVKNGHVVFSLLCSTPIPTPRSSSVEHRHASTLMLQDFQWLYSWGARMQRSRMTTSNAQATARLRRSRSAVELSHARRAALGGDAPHTRRTAVGHEEYHSCRAALGDEDYQTRHTTLQGDERQPRRNTTKDDEEEGKGHCRYESVEEAPCDTTLPDEECDVERIVAHSTAHTPFTGPRTLATCAGENNKDARRQTQAPICRDDDKVQFHRCDDEAGMNCDLAHKPFMYNDAPQHLPWLARRRDDDGADTAEDHGAPAASNIARGRAAPLADWHVDIDDDAAKARGRAGWNVMVHRALQCDWAHGAQQNTVTSTMGAIRAFSPTPTPAGQEWWTGKRRWEEQGEQEEESVSTARSSCESGRVDDGAPRLQMGRRHGAPCAAVGASTEYGRPTTKEESTHVRSSSDSTAPSVSAPSVPARGPFEPDDESAPSWQVEKNEMRIHWACRREDRSSSYHGEHTTTHRSAKIGGHSTTHRSAKNGGHSTKHRSAKNGEHAIKHCAAYNGDDDAVADCDTSSVASTPVGSADDTQLQRSDHDEQWPPSTRSKGIFAKYSGVRACLFPPPDQTRHSTALLAATLSTAVVVFTPRNSSVTPRDSQSTGAHLSAHSNLRTPCGDGHSGIACRPKMETSAPNDARRTRQIVQVVVDFIHMRPSDALFFAYGKECVVVKGFRHVRTSCISDRVRAGDVVIDIVPALTQEELRTRNYDLVEVLNKLDRECVLTFESP